MSQEQIEFPPVLLSHWDQIPSEFFNDFAAEVSSAGIPLSITPRRDRGIYAGVEWLIPTVVVACIAKSYFDGFVGEMGRDHYIALKSALAKLARKLALLKITIFASGQNKVRAQQPYSFAYSVIAEASAGLNFKLLLEAELDEGQCDEAIGAFLEFLQAYHSGMLEGPVVAALATGRAIGGTLLLSYSPNSRSLQVLDPLSKAA
ncbi:MAG: hypothetical protein ACJ8IR_13260 [Alphaproteobacteria bacterium]|jgi:hypothetical protein